MLNNVVLSLFLSASLFTGCSVQNRESLPTQEKSENLNTEKIELTEKTRGTNRIYTFTPNEKTVSVNGTVTRSSLASSEWDMLAKEINVINLPQISTLESPTTARYSDGALASAIAVTSNGKVYNSAEFDAGRPPKELEALYNKLKNSTGIIKNKPNVR